MSVRTLAISTLVLAHIALAAAAEQSPSRPPPPSVDFALYGPYPENYQKIVTEWLDEQLVDAKSAIVEFIGEPLPAEMPGPGGAKLYGFKAEFRVNSRNAFGAYTGMQRHSALIHNGVVVKATGFL